MQIEEPMLIILLNILCILTFQFSNAYNMKIRIVNFVRIKTILKIMNFFLMEDIVNPIIFFCPYEYGDHYACAKLA